MDERRCTFQVYNCVILEKGNILLVYLSIQCVKYLNCPLRFFLNCNAATSSRANGIYLWEAPKRDVSWFHPLQTLSANSFTNLKLRGWEVEPAHLLGLKLLFSKSSCFRSNTAYGNWLYVRNDTYMFGKFESLSYMVKSKGLVSRELVKLLSGLYHFRWVTETLELNAWLLYIGYSNANLLLYANVWELLPPLWTG